MNGSDGGIDEARLAALHAYLILDTPPEADFDDLVRLGARLCGAGMAAIVLTDRERHWCKSAIGLPFRETGRDNPFFLHALAQSGALVVADAREDRRFATSALVTEAPFVRFYAGIPLRSSEGHVLGTFCVMDPVARVMSPEQLDSLQVLARQVTYLLELRLQRRALHLKTSELDGTLTRLNANAVHLADAQRIAHLGSWELHAREGAPSGSLRWSDEIYRIFGVTRESFGASFDAFLQQVHPDDRAAVLAAREDAWRGLAALDLEFRIIRPDGEERHIRARGELLVAGPGGPEHLAGTMQDMTEKRRADAHLRGSEERFRAIFELSALGTAMVGLDGTWLLVNRRLCGILGYAARELQGRTFQSMSHPDELAESEGRLRALVAGESDSHSMEKRFVRGDGKPIWTRVTVTIVRQDGSMPAYFIAAIEDIHAQKEAELKLIESEFRYRQMFFSSPQPMWVGDRETRKFIDVNAAAIAHYGYSREEFLGFDLVDIRAPEIRDNPLESLLAPLPGEPVRKYGRRHRRKDGSIIHAVISVQWIDYEGRPAIVVLVNDITALVEAEQRVLKLNAELERRVLERTVKLQQANKELESFSYSVAHDLRAPLRAIHGFSKLLVDDEAPRLSPEGKHFLARVLKASQSMGEIIDDLLAYARVEREVAEVGSIDLALLCRAIVEARADEVVPGAIELRADFPPVRVRATHGGLTLALRNLLDNAVKFSHMAKPPRIDIGASIEGDFCTVWIRDNGIGFDMAYHDKIFEIFQRLHRADEYSGTGIGLAIVRKAMQRMGGQVWAQSAPGQGATFYLQLPVMR